MKPLMINATDRNTINHDNYQFYFNKLFTLKGIKDLFRLCPPSLVGAYYLQPPDARAIFLHNDLLCNDTCSVTGGSITYWGGTKTEKIRY